ncbi:MAG: adenylate cyclase [Planctomycetota bacterium]
MGVEIEHKFLVRRERLPRRLPSGVKIKQGYLAVKPVVRVRLITNARRTTAFLTIKGPGLRQRSEFEYAIPVCDARTLLRLCGSRVIQKIRRQFGPWELDEFRGRHRGLWLAEVELKSRHDLLPKRPAWIGKEVTNNRRFSNAVLAMNEL